MRLSLGDVKGTGIYKGPKGAPHVHTCRQIAACGVDMRGASVDMRRPIRAGGWTCGGPLVDMRGAIRCQVGVNTDMAYGHLASMKN